MKRVLNASLLLSFAFFSFASLNAQTTAGSIVGNVTDPSGAVVAGATVTGTNLDTNITTKASTDSSGSYVLTPLQIGHYSVTVEASGFKKSVESGITINVQDRVRVDMALQVGQIADTVEVQSSAPLLQTDTSYLGQVVDSRPIVDLPLNGRYFTQLAVLTTGTAPTPSGARDEKSGGFSANGVRPYQNNFLLDGMDNNSLSEDLVSQQSYVIGPPPDAIGEFRVQTNSMSAEFGRSGGAVLNVTVKSGTNQIHGTVFEFLRNSDLDARNFFDGQIPPYKQNQFGFSAGGPIKKDRTFIFGDYQGTRIRLGHTFLASVPDPNWKTGNFSGYQTIYDPSTTSTDANGNTTRTPFPNNQIPANRFDPVAAKLIALFPNPNVPGSVGPSGVANNYLTNPVEPDDVDYFDIRVDHKISDKDSIFGRLSFSDQNLTPPGPIPPPLDSASFSSGNFLNNARSVALAETHIFTPSIVNELRLGYTRNHSNRLEFNSDKNLSAQYGIPGIPFSANNGGLPAFSIDDLTGFGSSQYQPTVEIQNVWQIVDSVSWVKGRHTLKFGVDIKPIVNFSILQPPSPKGFFEFSGQFTRNPIDSSGGLGTADFLLGSLSNANISSFINDEFQQPGYFFYGQDDFKVSKNLTLNVGLRYEYVPHVSEKYNALANFNLDTNTLDIVKGRTDPLPADFYPEIQVNRNASPNLVPNNHLGFAPRFGFAYNPRPKTVIRGGYGIFYSSYEAGPLSIPNPGNNPPFYEQASYPAQSLTVPNPKLSQLSQGFPLNFAQNPDLPALFSLDPHFRNPYVQHWNFGAQQELGWHSVFEVEYAGSKGTSLYEFRDANEPLPSTDPNADVNARRVRPYLSYLPLWCSCSSSNYSSLQTKFEKHFSGGLSFLASYTFSKAIDEQSNASLGFHDAGSFRTSNAPGWERGPSDFDVRHRFVISHSYEIPVGKGKRWGSSMSPLADAIVGGWEIQGIETAQTGTPRTIAGNVNYSNDPEGEQRPNVVSGTSLYPASQGPNDWYNLAHFVAAAEGSYGNSGRNIITAPGIVNVDLSLFKDIHFMERYKLQFRGEMFNLLNHANFRSDSLNIRFDSAGAGTLTAAGPSRQIQFALKLVF